MLNKGIMLSKTVRNLYYFGNGNYSAGMIQKFYPLQYFTIILPAKVLVPSMMGKMFGFVLRPKHYPRTEEFQNDFDGKEVGYVLFMSQKSYLYFSFCII